MKKQKGKNFDQKLFNKFDRPAKEQAIEFLAYYEYEAIENPDCYGPDLIVFKNGDLIGYAECEVRTVWKNKEFPFESLSLPFRKKKFLTQASAEEIKIIFLVFNSDFSAIAKVKGQAVSDSPVVERSNRLGPENEKFFDIPLSQVDFYQYEDEAA